MIGNFPEVSLNAPADRVFLLLYSPAQNRFFAILRADDGTWGLPGGKVNLQNGETALQAVVRETEEEIGYTPENVLPLHDFMVGEQRCVVFLSRVSNFTPLLNSECLDYKWADIPNWPNPAHPQMTRFLREAYDNIQKALDETESRPGRKMGHVTILKD